MLLSLTDKSPEPLYGQIVRQVRAQVLAGDLPAETDLPSIRDLARSHRVSVITVQRAYEELVREGLIVARRGKGYCVADLAHTDKTAAARDRLKAGLRGPLANALASGLDEKAVRAAVEELLEEGKSWRGCSN